MSPVETSVISFQEYLNDFMGSFNNFISKCPIKLKSSLIDSSGVLYLSLLNNKDEEIDGINFTIDPIKDKKLQIKEIKEKIENWYPEIILEKESRYSQEEIDELVEKGTPLSEAMNKRHFIQVPKYKIIRVHHRFNELDCYDYKSGEVIKFKLKYQNNYKMSTALFLQKLRDHPIGMSKVFLNIFEFKFIIK